MFQQNIKLSITIFFIGLISVSVEGNVLTEDFLSCPEVCPALYAPVCAKFGDSYKEFGNECILQSANCRLRHTGFNAFSKTEMDWCTTELVENLNAVSDGMDFAKPECSRPCSMIYAPLCVSNGKYRTTVSSQCILDMYNCGASLNGSKSIFKVLKQGAC